MKHLEIFQLLKSKSDLDRLSWIKDKLTDLSIPFEDFNFTYAPSIGKKQFTNIYLPGSSSKMVIAHYDTVIPEFSANDNTASVINSIILKLRYPELNVAILDGEEPPCLGVGSNKLCEHLKNEEFFPLVDEILNLELTGVGRNVCLGARQQGSLKPKIGKFHSFNVPFSDSDILDRNNFVNNVVMFLLPDDSRGEPNLEYVYYCHTHKDNPSIIRLDDMEWFTDEYLSDFFKGWL